MQLSARAWTGRGGAGAGWQAVLLLWLGLNYWACVTLFDSSSCMSPHSKNGSICLSSAAGFPKPCLNRRQFREGKKYQFPNVHNRQLNMRSLQ